METVEHLIPFVTLGIQETLLPGIVVTVLPTMQPLVVHMLVATVVPIMPLDVLDMLVVTVLPTTHQTVEHILVETVLALRVLLIDVTDISEVAVLLLAVGLIVATLIDVTDTTQETVLPITQPTVLGGTPETVLDMVEETVPDITQHHVWYMLAVLVLDITVATWPHGIATTVEHIARADVWLGTHMYVIPIMLLTVLKRLETHLAVLSM